MEIMIMGEYGIAEGVDVDEGAPVIYVSEEPPRLLWRSIVQGFGLAIGFLLAVIMFWLLVAFFLALVVHRATPIPTF